MLERLKFKKKTDPVSSSAQQRQQQQQQQQPDADSTLLPSTFESTSSQPPLAPPSSSFSSTSPPVSYNNTNYIHSYVASPSTHSGGAPLPVSFSSSSTTNIQRSPSDSSAHNLHLKTSYHSMNNHFNQYNATTASVNQTMPQDNNYKVPLENVDMNVKVPVIDPSTRPNGSHTCSNNSSNSNVSNGSSNGTSSASRDSLDWRTTPANSTQQAPRTIAATKPTGGVLATATVNSSGEYAGSNTANHTHYNNANNTPIAGQAGTVPASATSSACPSRSSSTSNRGGAGMSTGGSFTPQSATPPMTPRTAPGITEGTPFSQGHEPVHANYDASARDRYSHPSSGNHYAHLTTPALHVQSQSSSSSSAFMNHNNNNNAHLSFGVDDPATAFVSSPIAYQPPAFQSFHAHEGIQPATGTLSGGANNNVHISTTNSLQRAKSVVNAGREILIQQQEYQNRQMEQFRENLDDPCDQSSTPRPIDTSGLSFSNGTGSQSSSNHHNPPLASAVAIAASLAGSPDGPRFHDDNHAMPSDHQQPPRPRNRTTSENDAELGARLDLTNNTGHSTANLVGSSMFSPPPRTNTALVASNLVTHDIRQASQRSHIEDGPGPVVLIAIGKTGQGKSSLLNKIMGTSELKASASVRAVTKGIAERSGWGRFEDSRRVLVTVADTPGLADTEGDDEKNIPILKEYIKSVGTRLGINAFLLVFKIDSGVDMIITILSSLNDIMKDFPNFWDNVVLVFTGCDYRRNVMHTKQLYHEEIQQQLEKHFMEDLRRPGPGSNRDKDSDDSSSESGKPTVANNTNEDAPIPIIPMVFLSCAEAPCGFSLGERCDCKARTTFLNAGIKRLWYKVREKKRWVLDQDEDDELSGHS